MNNLIEKIVERLEKLKEFYLGVDDWDLGHFQAYTEAISIIHEEAKAYNEEVCEWEYDGKFYEKCPHDEALFTRIHNCAEQRVFKFCPYCGKKIKAVE